jgi:hypothetical protein
VSGPCFSERSSKERYQIKFTLFPRVYGTNAAPIQTGFDRFSPSLFASLPRAVNAFGDAITDPNVVDGGPTTDGGWSSPSMPSSSIPSVNVAQEPAPVAAPASSPLVNSITNLISNTGLPLLANWATHEITGQPLVVNQQGQIRVVPGSGGRAAVSIALPLLAVAAVAFVVLSQRGKK